MHPTWLSVLKEEIVGREFLELKKFLKKDIQSGQKIFPPLKDVYSWYIPLSSIPHFYIDSIAFY